MIREEPFRRKVSRSGLVPFLEYIRELPCCSSNLMFVCIGTDRSTGDALGPLVGTMLEEAGYPHVIGTLEKPCDAGNLAARLEEQGLAHAWPQPFRGGGIIAPDGRVTLAIDACLGFPSSIGTFQVSNMPISPGKSVGRELPAVGDFSIAAIVNRDGNNKYGILQTTPLYRVMEMAKEVVTAIRTVFPLHKP